MIFGDSVEGFRLAATIVFRKCIKISICKGQRNEVNYVQLGQPSPLYMADFRILLVLALPNDMKRGKLLLRILSNSENYEG